jgi:predicted RND superfamily exporter protein
MSSIFSVNIPLFTLGIVTLIGVALYVLIELVILPWRMVKFYSNKKYITEFKPIVSTFSLEDESVEKRG